MIEVGHSGVMLTLFPQGKDVNAATEAIRASGARLDSPIGCYILRATDLQKLVKAAETHRVELRPSRTLRTFLLQVARELRRSQEFLDSVGGELYPYQNEGVGFLYQNPKAILADEMGLGKTIQALHALPPDAACAVCCPSFLVLNWKAEAERWRPDIRTTVIASRKEWRWPGQNEIVLCSYGKMPQTHSAKCRPLPSTHLIADEAHYLKKYKSARTRNFRKLQRRVQKAGGYTWLLTGTPIENTPKELWTMLQNLQLGRECYGTQKCFTVAFGGETDGLGVVEWTGNVRTDAMEPAAPYILRRKRAEVLPDLPLKTRRALTVSPPDPALRKELDKALTEHGEALQVADASWLESRDTWLELATRRKALANAKIPDLLLALPDYEDAGEPLVVFSAHRGPIEALADRPGWAAILGGISPAEKQARIEAFQAGELRGLACTIRAAGVGVTLTRAAHAIFVDLDWTPTKNLQAEDRLVRIGQTRGTQFTRLVCDHEIDHIVTGVLGTKLALLEKTTERINAPRTDPRRKSTANYIESIARDIPT